MAGSRSLAILPEVEYPHRVLIPPLKCGYISTKGGCARVMQNGSESSASATEHNSREDCDDVCGNDDDNDDDDVDDGGRGCCCRRR